MNEVFRDNTASYLKQVSRSLAKEFAQSKNANIIQKHTVTIVESKGSDTLQRHSPLVERIDENLLYEMNQSGFRIIDRKSMKNFGKTIESDYFLVSTYTNYKYEMVINSRIVDSKSGIIQASAQITVPRKIVRNVDKLYKRDTWFTPPK